METTLDTSRNATIKTIRTALKARSGKTWSVKGDRGSAWGWITIAAPPARMVDGWLMTDEDRAELAALLGLDTVMVQGQGVLIPAADDYYVEYMNRAQGVESLVNGKPYWD